MYRHILHTICPLTETNAPGFEVANLHIIFPISRGTLAIPNSTTIHVPVCIFRDSDLSENLFCIAPLVNLGCTATFTRDSIHVSARDNDTILYGTKDRTANIWRFSLPQSDKPNFHRPHMIIRHEQHAELVMFAYSTFGSPVYATFAHAVKSGWLSNYPDLTYDMLRQNTHHIPATALGHLMASRSNVRSTRSHSDPPPLSEHLLNDPLQALSATALPLSDLAPALMLSSSDLAPDTIQEALSHYPVDLLPDHLLRPTVMPSSRFRESALHADLTGRFPVIASDGTQYLHVSTYKGCNIHVDYMSSRSAGQLQ
jgi:hypothetical protein